MIKKVLKLQDNGFSIGIWGVTHPAQETEILKAKEYCISLGIDFRTKEFLGEHDGKMYGTYRYEGHVIENLLKKYYAKQLSLLSGLAVIFTGVTATFMKIESR
ncbi:hypothetical protein [Candidatus Kuenenia stuttgartiensis]|uniref:hypothetical protein n=1 Tax=Kuenenia stuttgartiensis TaxID=174633 RepID=UPI00146E0869|nr:hypothetical protein [Candidatus Kuenenia stuttgartiensis]